MAERGPVRVRYAELATCQRRLRHLRTIAVRNLDLGGHNVDQTNTQVSFTLHNVKTRKVMYTSEKLKGFQKCRNPTWKNFNLTIPGEEEEDTAMTSFIVKIWLEGSGISRVLLVNWMVDLTGLNFIGPKLQYDGSSYPRMTVCFGLRDGFYSNPPDEEITEKYRSISLQQCVMRIDQAAVRHSYTTSSLLRIQTVLRAIKQTQVVVQKIRKSIEERLCHSQPRTSKRSDREMILMKVNQMRADLEWRTMHLQAEKQAFEIFQTATNKRNSEIRHKFETLQKDKDRLQDKKRAYFDVREDLIKTIAQLVLRRKQLISELAFIYPINQVVSGDYTIAGARLPNSEDFAGQDETMIAVALGYTCHLVQMISHLLDTPVRYPMEHRGSRSRIKDHIHDKLTEKERDFPLYSKGKERFQFNYGVYLLNKNIAQLRCYCGLGTSDLRLTLPNVKTLLELRLGVKFDASTGTLLLSQTPTLLDSAEKPESHIPAPQNRSSPSVSQAREPSSDSSEFEILVRESTNKIPDEPGCTNQNNAASVPYDNRIETRTKPTEDLFPVSNDSFFKVKKSNSHPLFTSQSLAIHGGDDHLSADAVEFANEPEKPDVARKPPSASQTGLGLGNVTVARNGSDNSSQDDVKLWPRTKRFQIGDSEQETDYSIPLQTGQVNPNVQLSRESSPMWNEAPNDQTSDCNISTIIPPINTHGVTVNSVDSSLVCTPDNSIQARAALLSSGPTSFNLGVSQDRTLGQSAVVLDNENTTNQT